MWPRKKKLIRKSMDAEEKSHAPGVQTSNGKFEKRLVSIR